MGLYSSLDLLQEVPFDPSDGRRTPSTLPGKLWYGNSHGLLLLDLQQ